MTTKMTTEPGKTLYTFIIFSENIAGILNDITAVFSRRKVNIESLNTSASNVKGIHRYTLTCSCDEAQVVQLRLQIQRKVGVVYCNYYNEGQIFILEAALYKISTNKLLENPDISKAIRKHSANIVEVNPRYSIVTLTALTDDIRSLYRVLSAHDCIYQFVSSGAIAVTKEKHERINEVVAERKRRFELNKKKF